MLKLRRFAAVPATWILGAVFVLFGWIIGLTQLSDNSFLWHLQTGRYIFHHGFPRHDIFSYTYHGTWILQSWLVEIFYGCLDLWFGAQSIRILDAVISACVALLVFWIALRLSKDYLRAGGIALITLIPIGLLVVERPLLFGILFFALVVAVLNLPHTFVGRHPLVVLAVVFWFWGNSHGSWALGMAYVGLWLIGQFLTGSPRFGLRERQILLGAIVDFVILFVNPYTWRLVVFPVALLKRGQVLSHIVEWQSPNFRSALGIAFAVWIALLVISVARAGYEKSKAQLVVIVPFLLLSLWAQRNIPLTVLACLPIIAVAWRSERQVPSLRLGVVAILAFFCLGVGVADSELSRPAFNYGAYPVKALQRLKSDHLLGKRLITTDGWAGYVILNDWPQQRVFIDDRYDMYPMPLAKEYFDLLAANNKAAQVLQKHDGEVVLWPSKAPLSQILLRDDRWQVIYRDKKAIIFVRNQ